ncbi:MAG TPA: phosphohistidine phosphatase SixA [Candidatus Binataceae bacterium]|nr:phosphohistidine phosphatase SixA [Candidatus Binataceae bacterium]
MTLYVLRHAEAEDLASGRDDYDRALTQAGCDRTREAALGMIALGLKFDVILSSPKVRAVETASIVAAAYDKQAKPELLKALADEISAERAVAALTPYFMLNDVMIVGHEPQLSAICSLVLTGAPDRLKLKLKKGGCVAIGLPNGSDRAGAELMWMMTQKQLRKMRKNAG